jgi:hypothetical protein
MFIFLRRESSFKFFFLISGLFWGNDLDAFKGFPKIGLVVKLASGEVDIFINKLISRCNEIWFESCFTIKNTLRCGCLVGLFIAVSMSGYYGSRFFWNNIEKQFKKKTRLTSKKLDYILIPIGVGPNKNMLITAIVNVEQN